MRAGSRSTCPTFTNVADQTAMGLPAVRFSQLNGMRFGDRAEMRRWLDIVDRGFSQVADAIGVK